MGFVTKLPREQCHEKTKENMENFVQKQNLKQIQIEKMRYENLLT